MSLSTTGFINSVVTTFYNILEIIGGRDQYKVISFQVVNFHLFLCMGTKILSLHRSGTIPVTLEVFTITVMYGAVSSWTSFRYFVCFFANTTKVCIF